MSELEIVALEPETEHEPEAPRKGTRAWIDGHSLVEVAGRLVPSCHRLPADATFEPGEEDDGYCRVVMGERGRCRAPRMRGHLLCSAHAGGGDPEAATTKAVEVRARLKSRRMLLGIGSARAANPRQIARLAAHERAEEIARALVDAPLDDKTLGSIERQLAVVRALDATFPLQSMTVEVELPADGEGVQALGWSEMQALASKLLAE